MANFLKQRYFFAYFFVLLFALSVNVFGAVAQSEDELPEIDFELVSLTQGMDDEEIQILRDINNLRLRTGLPHLIPNSLLNAAADKHLSRLAARGRDIGNPHIDTEAGDIDDWLLNVGYPSFVGPIMTYQPDVLALASNPTTGGLTPDNIISYWVQNPALLTSYRTPPSDNLQPFYRKRFREVGIAYRQNVSNGTRYFVIIFASQPNALPVVVSQGNGTNELAVIRDYVGNSEVLLYIHNEDAVPDGDNDGGIGRVNMMRVSSQLEKLECPVELVPPDGWENYSFEKQYSLPVGMGEKSVYVYFCDSLQRMAITKATVVVDSSRVTIFEPPRPVPGTVDPGQPATAEPQGPSDIQLTETALAIAQATIDAQVTQQTETAIFLQTQSVVDATNTAVAVAQTQAAALRATELEQTAQAQSMTQTALAIPTLEPTVEPTIPPTAAPTLEPTVEPTIPPTAAPTLEPTVEPTLEPTTPPTAAPTTDEQPPTHYVQLVWNEDYLLLHNDSPNALDALNQFMLRSTASGALPEDGGAWVDDRSSLSGGGCLIVFNLEKETEIPKPQDVYDALSYYNCIREPALAGVGPANVVWAKSGLPHFNVIYRNSERISCDPAARECRVPLDGAAVPTPTPPPAGTKQVRIFRTDAVLIILNSGQGPVNLSGITFSSGERSFTPEHINGTTLSQLQSGSCFRFFTPGTDEEAMPDNVICDAVPASEMVEWSDHFWPVSQSFSVNIRGTVTECPNTSNNCTVTVP